MLWQEHLCNYIRRFGYCGAFRFKLLNFFYHLSIYHSRAAEYDFVLPYLAPIGCKFKIKVIDVGGSHSLLIYELLARGYISCGTDQRSFQEKIRKDIAYIKCDINSFLPFMKFDFVTCISTIEHVGAGEYGDKIDPQGDYKMIKKIAELLRIGGTLLLTTPTKEWTGKNFKQELNTICRGYDYEDLERLTEEWFKITRHEIRRGQHCLALTRIKDGR